MIPRAFLSHGTPDKDLVNSVANNLGRAAVVYDVFEFQTGDDLRNSIVNGLSQSDIFVLFASKQSLSRSWVKFEILEAEKGITLRTISRALTYIIDPQVSIGELPSWMQSTLITYQDSPTLIATDIRRVINERVAESRPTYFVGRLEESQEALEKIASFTDPGNRPPLIVYGLNGIGRRSLVRHIARDSLSYPKTLEIKLREGDLLPEFLLKLSSTIAHFEIENPNDFIERHASQSSRDLISEILPALVEVCSTSTLPIIFDQGAVATEDRVFRSQYELLYNSIAQEPQIDCIFVTNRRIHSRTGGELTSVRVSELGQSSVQNFVRLLSRDRSLNLSAADVESIVEYSRGYPPSVIFAMDEAQIYGVPHIISNQRALINFSAEIFLKQLTNDKKITNKMADVMQLLANYTPLPLPVIQRYLKIESNMEIAELMSYLIDFAFILPDNTLYRISEPVRDAAYRAFGRFRLDHGFISTLLEQYVEETEDDDEKFILAQNLFRATVLGNRKMSANAFRLASDLIHLTTQSYHDEEYENAIRFGNEAIEIRPDSVNVRRYLAQALIRKERYEEAEAHIRDMIDRGRIGEAFYVKGFMERRKHNYAIAISDYNKSIEYGRGGTAIHRELASCYFGSGDIRQAQRHIDIALQKSPHNRFIVDLQCTIAIRTGDFASAEKGLAVLEKVDPGGFFLHRMSTFEQARGRAHEALDYAEKAVQNFARPPFEILANLANCQIEMNQLAEAGATLRELQTRFRGTHHDASIGLRCKLEIRRENFDLATSLWNQIREKDTAVHLGLRLALLNRKSSIRGLSKSELEEQDVILLRLEAVDWDRTQRLFGSVLPATD